MPNRTPTPKDIQILPATLDEHDTLLRNLWQFYIYEFSRFQRLRTTPAGRFHEKNVGSIFTREQRYPFILYADQAVCGFAVVDSGISSHYTPASEVVDMSEFFILAGFQGLGIGAQVATRLFDQFPGQWEVFQLKGNVAAQHFWRTIIGRYTANTYREIAVTEGVVQLFESASAR
jgi:predicted acetyltransferase